MVVTFRWPRAVENQERSKGHSSKSFIMSKYHSSIPFLFAVLMVLTIVLALVLEDNSSKYFIMSGKPIFQTFSFCVSLVLALVLKVDFG
jgi:hypothetical protein